MIYAALKGSRESIRNEIDSMRALRREDFGVFHALHIPGKTAEECERRQLEELQNHGGLSVTYCGYDSIWDETNHKWETGFIFTGTQENLDYWNEIFDTESRYFETLEEMKQNAAALKAVHDILIEEAFRPPLKLNVEYSTPLEIYQRLLDALNKHKRAE